MAHPRGVLTLYHFPQSPFSRRVRLALAHKGLVAELRDARADAAVLAEANARSPLGTIPVLVDGATVLGDSLAILRWLDLAYPDRPLWSRDAARHAEALRLVASGDRALEALVDFGTRLFAFADHAAWPAVSARALGRAQAGLDALDAASRGRAGRPLLGEDLTSDWGAVDVATLAAALWLERLPQRAPTFAPAAQILSLGVALPPALAAWAASHRERPEVVALDAV